MEIRGEQRKITVTSSEMSALLMKIRELVDMGYSEIGIQTNDKGKLVLTAQTVVTI